MTRTLSIDTTGGDVLVRAGWYYAEGTAAVEIGNTRFEVEAHGAGMMAYLFTGLDSGTHDATLTLPEHAELCWFTAGEIS